RRRGRIRFRPARGRHMTVRRHLDLPFGTDADDVQPALLFRVAETTAMSAPGLSSDARWTPPADLISARLIKTLGSVAMPAYSHLLDEERDQIAVMRAAGRSICAIAGALQRAKSTVSRELRRNAPAGVIRRFTPPEPISCAGGVKPYSRKIRR